MRSALQFGAGFSRLFPQYFAESNFRSVNEEPEVGRLNLEMIANKSAIPFFEKMHSQNCAVARPQLVQYPDHHPFEVLLPHGSIGIYGLRRRLGAIVRQLRDALPDYFESHVPVNAVDESGQLGGIVDAVLGPQNPEKAEKGLLAGVVDLAWAQHSPEHRAHPRGEVAHEVTFGYGFPPPEQFEIIQAKRFVLQDSSEY